jgi:zinc D-Ala-D-Ala carboxypeptidase
MTKLTEHFTLEELCATIHTGFLAKNLEYGKSKQGTLLVLARFMEDVRRLLGDIPIIINSAVRCPELNKAVGGATTSQHCLCQAVDFTPTNHSLEEAVEILRKYLPMWGQIILERAGGKKWLHISLGYPYRPLNKCKQVLKYDGKNYINI